MMQGMKSADGVWSEQVGTGHDVLLLLHGMGANGAIWDPVMALAAQRWPGRIVAVDLPGHGRSRHLEKYAFGTMTADLAGLLASEDNVSIIGHSLGGALGAFLASGWFGVNVARVLALSVKVKWSEDEFGKGRSVAGLPVRWFATRQEAVERYLKLSGLGVADETTLRSANFGIMEHNGQYRLAMDQQAFGAAAPGVVAMMAQARCAVRHVVGAADPIAPPADFHELGLDVAVIADAGHQLPLDAPGRVW